MLRLAEQNNSVTALFFIHFSKWTNVLLLAVINTINTKFTCRKICLTETATQSTDNSRLFSSGYKQTITPTRKNVRWCRTWRRLLVYNNGDFKLFSWNLQRFTLWKNVSLNKTMRLSSTTWWSNEKKVLQRRNWYYWRRLKLIYTPQICKPAMSGDFF